VAATWSTAAAPRAEQSAGRPATLCAHATDPIDDHRGDVYQYVGDEIVVTWTVAEGRDGAQPVACFFAIERALARPKRSASQSRNRCCGERTR
jgi:adenylate cyclase